MLKETETEKNDSLFCDILSLVAFQLGGGGTTLDYAYGKHDCKLLFSGREFKEIHINVGLQGTSKQVRIPPSTK